MAGRGVGGSRSTIVTVENIPPRGGDGMTWLMLSWCMVLHTPIRMVLQAIGVHAIRVPRLLGTSRPFATVCHACARFATFAHVCPLDLTKLTIKCYRKRAKALESAHDPGGMALAVCRTEGIFRRKTHRSITYALLV